MLYLRTTKAGKKPRIGFKPDFIASSVSEIDFQKLREIGIRHCLIDLDDTVVERAAYAVSTQTKKALRLSGMTVYIATNRPKSRDLRDLKVSLGATGVIHPHGIMGKPTKTYFTNALKDSNINAVSTVMIGDRIIQDIFGANRAGIYSLLVYKLGKPKGSIDSLISYLEHKWTVHISGKYETR